MHQPVLTREVLALLDVRSGGTYIDATVGSGGHARAILDAAGSDGFLLGLDRDPAALERAGRSLRDCAGAYRLVHANFAELGTVAADVGVTDVNGIVMDVGVSSDQLETPGRGFSFAADGPLDMRMNPHTGPTAADLVNALPEEDLAALFREKGEERHARRIARAVVRARTDGRIETTLQLAGIVERVAARRGRLHPATRVFQALRIAVNDELECLSAGLEAGIGQLCAGGRLAVISFHSLEDRIAKRCFADHAGRWESLQAGGRAWRGREPQVKRVTKKPVEPSTEEIERNPRARSARLRVVERMVADRPEN